MREALKNGKRVLLVTDKVAGRKTHFASHFWNPIMFNWDPMIVGTLIQDRHPLFRNFPTKAWADWQWWDILNYTKAVDLTELRNLTPLVQSIDSYEYNQKLGIVFEAKVGNGRLLTICMDAVSRIDERPATKALLNAARAYVADDSLFAPAVSLQPYEVDAVFGKEQQQEKSLKESAAVKQLLNQ